MTNEEARAILEEVKTIDDSMYQYNPAYLEALDMAIEALKQPTDGIYITHKVYSDLCLRAAKAGDLERELTEKKAEPCEDAVSREAVKKLYCNICMDKNICYRNKENCEELILFDKLPPVSPKPRTGKWIVKIVGKPESGGTLGKYICDNCQKAIWATAIEGEPNFCPMCGAEMEGE